MGVHLTAFLSLLLLQTHLAHLYNYGAGSIPISLEWIWLGLMPFVIVSLPVTFVSWRQLAFTLPRLGIAWIYAALCCLLTVYLRSALALSWDSPTFRLGRFLQEASFYQVATLLRWIGTTPYADPASHVLGTRTFLVQIASSCSGVEGLALISVLTLAWLLVERRQLRAARVLLLVPVALSLIWILNLIRLVVLIEIGSAGHPDLAINGFHSQAGWIFFNVVSFAFLLTVQRVLWFRKSFGKVHLPEEVDKTGVPQDQRNAVAIYLAPFLAITAGSLLSRAFTGGFEWLYPIRLVAALAMLWFYRKEYGEIKWRFGALGPATGIIIGLLWIALHYRLGVRDAITVPAPFIEEFNSAPHLRRLLWTVARILAAVITVPVAEELAFRGFLARRLMSASFESMPYYKLSTVAIIGSSIAFGLLHGQMWLAGSVAGIAFGLVAKKKGSLGEAVAAHAFANLVLSIVVLIRGDFTLWS